MRHLLLQPFSAPLRSRFLSVLQRLKRVGLSIVFLELLLLLGLLLPFRALAQPITFVTVGTTLGRQNFAGQSIASVTSEMPAIVVARLRQDLSQRTQLPLAKLKLIEAKPKTWNDGCLDMAAPEEICTQALVKGWRVVFANANQRWIYRTDHQGRILRLER
ncbi:hypothetical protein H6F76_05250 [Leptolyngbya sp. FACHB-321]|uniref:hypothetical protein n=1 Tax=Leptolyngbya sp. FACHB-321 TaxID=2692807 RepID=UPI00168968A1|nr:hypothetical protein [Leptolyngbya sp. FACHB-321]MBD2034441.1 hypothetical protein [Leptolyngbya sp. FACHB-321]